MRVFEFSSKTRFVIRFASCEKAGQAISPLLTAGRQIKNTRFKRLMRSILKGLVNHTSGIPGPGTQSARLRSDFLQKPMLL